MKYFFILGRNPRLSIAEIFSYFEKEKLIIKSYFSRYNMLLIESDNKINTQKIIDKLGGSIAVGRVLFSGDINSIKDMIAKENIYFENENKFNYSLISFENEDSSDSILSAIRDNFKRERLKAQYKGVREAIKMQSDSGEGYLIAPKDINYFLIKEKEYNFGVVDGTYNPQESERRDMGKPARRESLAISPRLAKILINLAQVREEETLLDPFCGIGVILQEALLQDINVVGVDIDKGAIINTKKNLGWLNKNYKIRAKSEIINQDSKRVKLGGVDGIATEPSLGNLLKKVPDEQRAYFMLAKFENLIISVLNNLKKYIKNNGKIAFSAPLIKLDKWKRRSCNIDRICMNTGLRLYRTDKLKFPIEEFREKQVLGREFYVLTKV